MRDILTDVQDENGLIMGVYLYANGDDYTNEEAAQHLQDPNHFAGTQSNYWTGIHPAFNDQHGVPFTAVIELSTGKVLATDPIPEFLTPAEVMAAVKEANSN